MHNQLVEKVVSFMPNRVRQSDDWKTWFLGAFMTVLMALVTWGYQSIQAEIAENRNMVMELQKSGTQLAREQLAAHEIRLLNVERSMEKNDEQHQRIITELSLLRDLLSKNENSKSSSR